MKRPEHNEDAGNALRGRILAAFPAGHYALDAFFRLTDIVVTDRVDTAAVECVAAPRMLVNGQFVSKHCATDEHLFMLILHELHHVLMGHTTLFKRTTVLDNIAFDAVINAILSQLFREPMYYSFFQKLYKPDRLPDALLRPPDGWPKEWDIPMSLPKPVSEMIRVLYSEASGTYKEVYDLFKKDTALKEHLAGAGIPLDGRGQDGTLGTGGDAQCPLLGDHSPEGIVGRGESAANSPALEGAVRSIVEKWPMPPDPIRGRSSGRELREILLEKVKTPPTAQRILERLIRKMVEEGPAGGVTRYTLQDVDRTIEHPLPTLRDRRALVAASFGWQPLVYRTSLEIRRRRKERGITSVYVDVSGSVARYRSLMASLVKPYVLRKRARLFVFSEVVDAVTPDALKRGIYKTTDGTDAVCIWKHASENGFRKIVVLTDGYVGKPPRYWSHELSKNGVRICVALVADGYMCDLEDIADEIIELPLELT
ncbi:MAG: hypothetical protein Q8R39_02285 [bacterium]|nr:hypothetical protein [bacterium]